MSRRPVVAVYTPILNEAKHIERWAEAARQADVLVMTDTGSEDSSYELAKSCGIEVNRAWIEPFRFDDARNVCMYSIPRHVDIALQVDADEVLQPGWRDELDQTNPAHNRWSYWLTNDRGGWAKVRRQNCVRMGKGFRWEHPIHEVISGPSTDAHLDTLEMMHTPDRQKSRAYAFDMLKFWSDADPDDARTLFYLGREYGYKNMWNESRQTLWRYLSHPKATWGPERGEAYMMIAKMDNDPVRWLWKSIAEEPRRREPFVRLAKHYMKRQDWDLARGMVLEAATRTDMGIYTAQSDCWGDEFVKLVTRIESKFE